MKKTALTVTDNTEDLKELISRFKNEKVLVGIPEGEASRDPDPQGKMPDINNAHILAIAEFGSPKNNIPARPVLSTGIRNARAAIAEQFKKAAQTALGQGFSALDRAYERAGIIASTACKKVINSQEGIKPPSEATLAARKADGFSGTKALLVTGQMRNAITYVVKGKK